MPLVCNDELVFVWSTLFCQVRVVFLRVHKRLLHNFIKQKVIVQTLQSSGFGFLQQKRVKPSSIFVHFFLTTVNFSELLLLGMSTVVPLIMEGEGRLFLVFSKGFDENSSLSFSCSSCTNQILKLSCVKSENFDSCSVPGLFKGSTFRHEVTIVIEKSDLHRNL